MHESQMCTNETGLGQESLFSQIMPPPLAHEGASQLIPGVLLLNSVYHINRCDVTKLT